MINARLRSTQWTNPCEFWAAKAFLERRADSLLFFLKSAVNIPMKEPVACVDNGLRKTKLAVVGRGARPGD